MTIQHYSVLPRKGKSRSGNKLLVLEMLIENSTALLPLHTCTLMRLDSLLSYKTPESLFPISHLVGRSQSSLWYCGT